MGFPVLTNNPLFVIFNFTYVIQVILITHRDICINAQASIRMRPVTMKNILV